MNLYVISRLLVTVALVLQLWRVVNVNKFVCPTTFYLLAAALYLMAVQQYHDDYAYTEKVIMKTFHGTLALLIALYVR